MELLLSPSVRRSLGRRVAELARTERIDAGIVHVYRWGKTRFFVHQPVAPAPAKA